MSDGKTHANFADMAIVGGIGLAYYGITNDMIGFPLAAGLVTGLVIGKYASPDVRDQEDVRNFPEHEVYRELGYLPGLLWQGYWEFLASKIEHRSWKSHLPGPATLIAWLWLFVPILAICGMVYPEWLLPILTFSLLTFPGWMLQDAIHLALDGGPKAIRWKQS